MTDTTVLDSVLERALAGAALSADDWATLTSTPDILSLGMAADELRRRRHGDRITFLRVVDIDLAAADGDTSPPVAAGEIRVHGALDDPRCLDRLRAVAAAAGRTPVTGFSLTDVERTAGGDLDVARRRLESLAEAGLGAIADAPVDELTAAERLIAIAADAGLGVARVTVKNPITDPAGLLRRAASLFGAEARLPAFAPLPRTTPPVGPTTGHEDVRMVALARLLVPADHIQVSWAAYGPKLAQVALTFGADDVDEVSPRDEVSEGRRRAPLAEIIRNIEAAGGRPVARTGRFELLD